MIASVCALDFTFALRHNHNHSHKKMFNHFLMIMMIISVFMYFQRSHYDISNINTPYDYDRYVASGNQALATILDDVTAPMPTRFNRTSFPEKVLSRGRERTLRTRFYTPWPKILTVFSNSLSQVIYQRYLFAFSSVSEDRGRVQ